MPTAQALNRKITDAAQTGTNDSNDGLTISSALNNDGFLQTFGGCGTTVLYIEADYTGVPMRREELVGKKGKAPDGQAETRMAALGCVFTQHGHDDEGLPLRDHQSTAYLAGFESPSDFGIGLRREALRRGMGSVEQSARYAKKRSTLRERRASRRNSDTSSTTSGGCATEPFENWGSSSVQESLRRVVAA